MYPELGDRLTNAHNLGFSRCLGPWILIVVISRITKLGTLRGKDNQTHPIESEPTSADHLNIRLAQMLASGTRARESIQDYGARALRFSLSLLGLVSSFNAGVAAN